ncbi:MAG: Gfo/Idh/MocA family oxidoreductase [Armatimonadota bacterium]
MQKKPVNMGIVGLGRAGWFTHCDEISATKSMFKIVAACDPIAERRENMANRFGCKPYERIEDLVADPQVELVNIATRSCDHFKHAEMALLAGKDVFLEKPMCTDYAHAMALTDLAESTGRRLYIRHNRRFEPAYQHVREIIASGILGEVYQIKLRRHSFQRRDDWQTILEFGGGQLLNWGPHIIDHALHFLESPVKSIWSNLKRVAAGGDAEDHVRIILTGENGRNVDLEISGGVAIAEPVYMVYGTRGSLTSDEKTITLRYINPEQKLAPVEANAGTPGTANYGTPADLDWVEETIPVAPKYKVELSATIWEKLYNAIREGEPFPITSEEALAVMRIISQVKADVEYILVEQDNMCECAMLL